MLYFFFSSRRRHTRCALVTGVQTCALPILVTVRPDASIAEIAHLLLERRISAVPVVDLAGRLLGIVSEGDLMRRPESGTGRHPSWWLSLIASPDERAMAYVKAHGGHARAAMTRDVISVSEEASLEDFAELLEKTRIQRVTVLRAVTSYRPAPPTHPPH